MPSTTVRWITGQQFVGMDDNKHAVVLSGEKVPNGMRPSQMLMVALSACTAVDVVDILTKKRTPPSRLEIVATGGRLQPTYGEDHSSLSNGALVDRDA